MTKDESIERIQENLGKLVDVAQSCVSQSEYCERICKNLKGKRRSKAEEDDWCDCGCVE